ncbi:MAG: TolC family protein, partial [Verrucomicrobiota bacterium]
MKSFLLGKRPKTKSSLLKSDFILFFLLSFLLFLSESHAGASRPRPDPEKDLTSIAPEAWKSEFLLGTVQNGWIAQFQDPQLVALVHEALENNPDILTAAARLEEAEAIAKKAGADLYPTLNFQISDNKQSHFKGTGDPKRPSDVTSFGPSLNLQWELDIWGRVRSAKRSATNQLQASVADLYFARLSLAAQVAKAWFIAVESKEHLRLTDEFFQNFQNTLKIVQARYDNGISNDQDLYTAKAD